MADETDEMDDAAWPRLRCGCEYISKYCSDHHFAVNFVYRGELEAVAAENQRLREAIQRVRNANLNVLEIDPPTLCFSSEAMHDCWACGVGFVFREIRGALGASGVTADV